MPRLFVALGLPDTVRDALIDRQNGLDGARWIEPGDLHITLRFVGDVSGGDARALDRELEAVRGRPFALSLADFDAFGGAKPRSLFARVAPDPALTTLQARIERACQAAEMEPERRRFSPHVTLGRLRGNQAVRAGEWLARQAPLRLPPFPVTHFGLYSARASVGGGPYVLEADYPLEPAASSEQSAEKGLPSAFGVSR